MSDQPQETQPAVLFEFRVWADGQAMDADGNPLDRDGNPITQPDQSEPGEAQE